jgi:hypothetical protein
MTKLLLHAKGPGEDPDTSIYLDDSNGKIGYWNAASSVFTSIFEPADDNLANYIENGPGTPAANGYVPVKQIIRANATRTFTSDNNVQAMFTTPAGGTYTAGVGTYLFEGLFKLNTLGADSGNFLITMLGGGTATTAAWLWMHAGLDATDPTAAAALSAGFAVTSASPAAALLAATGTGAGVFLKGTFEVTAAGTLIPSIDQANTAGAAVLEIGSYICFEKISESVAVTEIGPWT